MKVTALTSKDARKADDDGAVILVQAPSNSSDPAPFAVRLGVIILVQAPSDPKFIFAVRSSSSVRSQVHLRRQILVHSSRHPRPVVIPVQSFSFVIVRRCSSS
ncbi:uncharacterized protein A4U43_C06F320 [Asparagus officinalis]|uniref:Uncharacterized protein n=1 Tax=Asparagus officinalis TaxID=4686 RepID=A0A5P1EIE7_ASPOF|nr:uncharacterized protein A4U43_C06F320 [Asparagus officinalis]